jgi:peptidoglycan/xylan/chitin deacetylase (PgdA/CDA1 family)
LQKHPGYKHWLLLAVLIVPFSVSAGEIALSFDDAPRGNGAEFSGMERTQSLIARLDSSSVDQVVFFCNTERLQWHQGVRRLELYAEAGHLLANHSHQHRAPSDLGIMGYIKDIELADQYLSPMSGFVRWYRFPYLNEGESRPARDSIRAALDSLDYFNGYVTVDNSDWYMSRLFQQARRAGRTIDYDKLGELYVRVLWDAIQFYDQIGREVLGRSPRHMLLLHENDLAALFIGALVAHIRSQGWKIISPTEAFEDGIASRRPDVLLNNQGRVAAIAAEAGWPRRKLSHPAEDQAYLDSLFEAASVFQ